MSELAQEPTVRLVGPDYVAEGTPSWRIRYAALAGPARSSSPALDDHLLAWELWQISHFGWIPEGAIRRNLSVAAGQEFPVSVLAAGLDRLVERGWIQQQEAEAGTAEREWRLTDAGRDALPTAASRPSARRDGAQSAWRSTTGCPPPSSGAGWPSPMTASAGAQ